MVKKKLISSVLVFLMMVNIVFGIAAADVRGAEGAAPAAAQTWQPGIFGSGVAAASNTITVNADKSVSVESLDNKGKISSNADGISFYYAALDAGKPFQITAKAHVDSFAPGNNQVSFGLMLRNTIGENESTAGHNSNLVAVGALNQKLQAFYRTGVSSETDSEAKLATPVTLIDSLPKAGDNYILKITKTGDNKCIVSIDSQTAVIDTAGLFTGSEFYLGLFTARNAKVTFSDINLVNTVSSIAVTGKPANTDYLLQQPLELAGLEVAATFADGSKKVIPANDYMVSSLDGATVGTNTVTVYYGGKTAAFEVNVKDKAITAMKITYTPAKTTYYIDDQFDALGLAIDGTYNTGTVKALSASEYTLSGFDSSKAGEKTVTATLNEDTKITASFKVNINASKLQKLEITRQPAKTQYYLGDELNLTGLVVSALYDDGSKAILRSGEYTIRDSRFNTVMTGKKTVEILYKGKSQSIVMDVKAKSLQGIEVTTLPKTTYYTGESFDPAGMVISKYYDNSSKEVLAESAFTVDSKALKSDVPGTYDIKIIPGDKKIKEITFPVTVREKATYTWKSIEFGQSTKPSTNIVEPSEPGTVNGTITLKALDGGAGKVTGAHDGISYYYTELDATEDNFVLSADIKVIEFAKETPDRQEAFGIMARDAIGANGDASVFSSNIVAVGGYRGTTQAFIRTGVTSSSGNEGTVQTGTSWTTPRPKTENTYPAGKYRLTLAKTNTGFSASLNNLADSGVLYYEPDIMKVQDSKIYVGFYTARLATIEVSNVSFSVSSAATDAPKISTSEKPVAPALNVLSLQGTSKTDYVLKLMPAVNGTLTIKQGETVIASDIAAVAKQEVAQKATLTANSDTVFTITFTPDELQSLTSYDRMVTNFAVTMKTYEPAGGAIFVSPEGKATAAGTKESPLDLDTAVKYVKEGQKIYMLGGTYKRTVPLTIPAGNDGTAAAMKVLAAYNGEEVILDFGTKSKGVILGANYWHFYGIDVTKASGVGFAVGGSYNKVELCDVYANGDTGLQISRVTPVGREFWPAYNFILNCEAYDNRDPSENNADGFAAKITCGEGNVFKGCISRNNTDDGWDLYAKAESGPIGVVTIEDCIAYNNGTLTNGYVTKGDKNGFKLGGEGIAVSHVIKNSIAFGNGAAGFTSNSNPSAQAANCVSYDNKGSNISFTSYAGIPLQFKIDNFVSFRSAPGSADRYPSSAESKSNYFCDGTSSVSKSGVALDSTNFASIEASVPYQRDAIGNIIWGDFLKFIAP